MKRAPLELAVGIFVIIGLACVGYLTVKLGKMELMGDKYYALYANFTSVTGLKPGSNVEIAGVRIGQVDAITLDPVVKTAKVKMKINKGVELQDDSIASIKTSGLIGDKFIMITPGGAVDPIEHDGTITETEPALDIEDLVSKYVFGDKKDKKKN